MANLTLDRVSKTYQQKGHPPTRAVIDFSLKVGDGEIVGLVGSSGCGKTSTLRMVAGFESVSEGIVRLGDRVLNDLKPAERNVAMAFETYALYPPLKVADNIAFSLLRNKMPKARAHEKVQMIADLLEINDLLELYPPTLSGGQQQRVSLARALVRTADLFLLDEPMSQLEPHLRAKLRARIKDYLIEHKMTAVFVTHDQTEAMALADRIAVMDEGLLQQFGSPVDLKERPANLFVASFIGEPPRNLLKAQVAIEGGVRKIVVQNERGETAFSFALPALEALAPLANGRRIHLGIRPHKIHRRPGQRPPLGPGDRHRALQPVAGGPELPRRRRRRLHRHRRRRPGGAGRRRQLHRPGAAARRAPLLRRRHGLGAAPRHRPGAGALSTRRRHPPA